MSSPGFANLRDVATGLPPGTIRPGLVFRSDAPAEDDPVPNLPGWPPTDVIDLRAPDEHEHEHPYARTANVHRMSLLASASPKEARRVGVEPALLLKAYRSMVSPRAGQLLAHAVDVVAHARGSTLIHCAAGKDRTGVTVAFLLRLCGIDRALIMTEYLLTDAMRERLIARLSKKYGFDPEVEPIPANALLASREGLDAMMDSWDASHGGTVGWYLEHGGSDETLAVLRARLLSSPAAAAIPH